MSAAAAVRLRPRRHCGGLVLLVTLLWLVSANYNNNLGFILTYLLAGLAATAAWHTRRQPAGVAVRLLPPAPVFAGETATLPLEIVNGSVPCWQLCLEIDGVEPYSFTLGAGERRRLTLAYPTWKRGVYRIGPPVLASGFPLGLFRASRQLDGEWKLWVYPPPAAAPPAPPGGGAVAPDGEREFAGIRPYRPGDSPRRIDWKALARGRGLLIREFTPVTAAGSRLFDWETLPPAATEVRLGWLCRWLLDAEQTGERYGLRLPGVSLGPSRGTAHLHACLRALARFPGGADV